MLLTGPVVAQQSGKENKLYRKAERYFLVANYGKSISAYKSLVELSPDNFEYNYKLGVSLYYSYNSSDKAKSLPYFEKALMNMQDTTAEIYYYLGRTNQIKQNFDEAIKHFEKLKVYFNRSQTAIKDLEEIDNYISQCHNATEFLNTPLQVKITNLGPKINSESADYAPAISADESILVFTSKREGTTGRKVDDDGRFYEDVYISYRENRESEWDSSEKIDTGDAKIHFFKSLFANAEKISSSINTRDHDASISLTPDGKTLFLYRKSDIWKSTRTADRKWSRPERLPEIINSKKYHEPSVSMSKDANTLYVVSERPGGFGGKDIYKTIKDGNGNWSELQNLGPTINTRFNEESPFIHPDGKTLYFSSDGHKSMGGYDIFKTTLENGEWTEPVNLGSPINTAANDIFFVINEKGDHGYFASIQEGDNYGDLDIYLVSPAEVPNASPNLTAYIGIDSAKAMLDLIASNNASGNIGGYANNGKVYTVFKNNGVYSDDGNIMVRLSDTPDDTNSYVSSSGTGQKLYNLPAGMEYALSFDSEGYPSHSIDITIPEDDESNNYYQEVQLEDIKEGDKVVGRKMNIYTVLLDMDSAIADIPAYEGMSKHDAYATWLKSNNYDIASSSFIKNSFTDYLEGGVIAANNNSTNNNNTSNNGGDVNLKDFDPILFDFAKSFLRPASKEELEQIYAYLKDNKNVKLVIVGHTDSKGPEDYNLVLSRKRAASAKTYFTGRGIASSRIKTIGKGESQPIAPNENPDKTDNPEGRQLNRRVEFQFQVK